MRGKKSSDVKYKGLFDYRLALTRDPIDTADSSFISMTKQYSGILSYSHSVFISLSLDPVSLLTVAAVYIPSRRLGEPFQLAKTVQTPQPITVNHNNMMVMILLFTCRGSVCQT